MRTKVQSERLAAGYWRVVVHGELDTYSTPELVRELEGARMDGATCVSVDLTDCEFMDSTALGALAGANRELRNAGGGLSLTTSNGHILKVLNVTGLDRVIDVTEISGATTGARV